VVIPTSATTTTDRARIRCALKGDKFLPMYPDLSSLREPIRALTGWIIETIMTQLEEGESEDAKAYGLDCLSANDCIYIFIL
jgi:hypothetical protein